VLARRSGESADEAYTAGLLHEVGWLLGVSTESAAPDQDHAASGGRLLAKWNLPDPIVAATTFHHARPDALTGRLDRVVVAAHAFAESLGASSPERSLTTVEALHLVGLADARPSVITNEIEAELASVTRDLIEQR
jgi:HD-like signal output (HDOD) protein